jgi:hypothetical protein
MHICFKIVKFLLQSMSLYMFRTLLCPSSGAFHQCTCSLWLPCDFVLVASSSTVLLIYDFKTEVHLVGFMQSYELYVRSIVNAPWYVQNTILHTDLQVPTVKAEITNFSTKYEDKLITHPYELIPALRKEEPRIKRFKPSELTTRFS